MNYINSNLENLPLEIKFIVFKEVIKNEPYAFLGTGLPVVSKTLKAACEEYAKRETLPRLIHPKLIHLSNGVSSSSESVLKKCKLVFYSLHGIETGLPNTSKEDNFFIALTRTVLSSNPATVEDNFIEWREVLETIDFKMYRMHAPLFKSFFNTIQNNFFGAIQLPTEEEEKFYAEKIFKILNARLEKGIDPNATCDKFHPLSFIACNINVGTGFMRDIVIEMARRLVEKGSNPKFKIDGTTPYDQSKQKFIVLFNEFNKWSSNKSQ